MKAKKAKNKMMKMVTAVIAVGIMRLPESMGDWVALYKSRKKFHSAKLSSKNDVKY